MVEAKLSAQAADQSALVGRAKDMLGVATISSTITGVLANDKLFAVGKDDADVALFVAMAVALLLVIICAFYAMRPRTWYLAPSPEEVAATVRNDVTAPVDDYYASVAMGFMSADVAVDGKTVLAHNDDQIDRLRTAVLVQIPALGVLAAAGLVLAVQTAF